MQSCSLQCCPKDGRSAAADVLEEIEKCKTDAAVKEVGIEWCIQQSKELIQYETPCLHFYTMGASETTRIVASGVF